MTPAETLEQLLAEDPSDAAARADGVFAELRGDRDVVIHGAGGVGRKALHALRSLGIEPVCFSDQGAAGESIDGFAVLPHAEAAARHGDSALFVTAILNADFPLLPAQQELRDLGVQAMTSWIPLGWATPSLMLPHYGVDRPEHVLAHADSVRAAFQMLADERSREEFVGHIAWRLTADFSALVEPRPVDESYFTPELYKIASDDVFADCGAFDGDTIASLAALRPEGIARVIAYEPDPQNLAALDARLAAMGSPYREVTDVVPVALGTESATARWTMPGTTSAAIDPAGELVVQVEPLTAALPAGAVPTVIKMDIEGAEPDALTGAEPIIKDHHPVLAICVYHRQDHPWSIPLQIAAMVDGYRYFLRSYRSDGWELVLYAIPPERLVTNP